MLGSVRGRADLTELRPFPTAIGLRRRRDRGRPKTEFQATSARPPTTCFGRPGPRMPRRSRRARGPLSNRTKRPQPRATASAPTHVRLRHRPRLVTPHPFFDGPLVLGARNRLSGPRVPSAAPLVGHATMRHTGLHDEILTHREQVYRSRCPSPARRTRRGPGLSRRVGRRSARHA